MRIQKSQCIIEIFHLACGDEAIIKQKKKKHKSYSQNDHSHIEELGPWQKYSLKQYEYEYNKKKAFHCSRKGVKLRPLFNQTPAPKSTWLTSVSCLLINLWRHIPVPHLKKFTIMFKTEMFGHCRSQII